ncbi:MAG: DsbA family protein, partial [Nanoarchaeota archaeon]|nr:DsbA family protein [Nanoarchaeota archaeon]
KKKIIYGIVAAIAILVLGFGTYFFLFSQPVSQIPRAEHFLGDANAKVVVTEYSDFQCPACGAAEAAAQDIAEFYSDRIKFVFRHFPLASHHYAQKAAEAAECAGAQGKFWEMHHKLFENQKALRASDLKTYAQQIGLNMTAFSQCLDSGAAAANVNADYNNGVAEGVRATPSFFINGRLIEGAAPFEDFKAAIDRELAAAG